MRCKGRQKKGKKRGKNCVYVCVCVPTSGKIGNIVRCCWVAVLVSAPGKQNLKKYNNMLLIRNSAYSTEWSFYYQRNNIIFERFWYSPHIIIFTVNVYYNHDLINPHTYYFFLFFFKTFQSFKYFHTPLSYTVVPALKCHKLGMILKRLSAYFIYIVKRA